MEAIAIDEIHQVLRGWWLSYECDGSGWGCGWGLRSYLYQIPLAAERNSPKQAGEKQAPMYQAVFPLCSGWTSPELCPQLSPRAPPPIPLLYPPGLLLGMFLVAS